MGWISSMLVLCFSTKKEKKNCLGILGRHHCFCHTPRRGGCCLRAWLGSHKQFLPSLTEGFSLCRVTETRVVARIPQLRLLTCVCVWLFPPQVSINLGLVYKVQHHTGIIFQVLAFSRRRQRAVPEILAAGGRYDVLVRASPVCTD